MSSEPRTIKGPCFKCEQEDWPCDCSCHYADDAPETVPTPKIDPEQRPNVPPRLW